MAMNHTHNDDDQGRQASCREEKMVPQPRYHWGIPLGWTPYLPAMASFIALLVCLLLDKWLELPVFNGGVKLFGYLLAYLPVALPVLRQARDSLHQGRVFTEFLLMSVATLGALAIGEYPEAISVMLFYTVGELFQTAAVKKSKDSIRALLDVRPRVAHVYRDDEIKTVDPEGILIGEIIQVRVGEKIPLDGKLLSEKASLNTMALTGESKPQFISRYEKVMAGSINLREVIDVKVEKIFSDGSMARILHLVQEATTRKSETELLIRRLAKIYTPIVVYSAIAILVLPAIFLENYQFSDWLYRALIFLVISCPCALVISIPLGYFGGLGAASRQGLLFKGAAYLDKLTEIDAVVLDKTGTLTEGVFKIREIECTSDQSEAEFMQSVMAVARQSNHPIGKAILEYDQSYLSAHDVQEHPGMGLSGWVEGHNLLIGNEKLLSKSNIAVPADEAGVDQNQVFVAIDGKFAGRITISDQLKIDAEASIRQLRDVGIKYLGLLSGDQNRTTQKIAQHLQLDYAAGDLLPEDKLVELQNIQANGKMKVAFVGDGINDAPALAASDVGIAMGGLGSDVAIETADVIIQTDQPGKIATGIKIGRATKQIIWQNITLALGIKAVVLVLGANGMATMWAAVFADVGVALLAILNAVRLQHRSWN